MQPIRKEEEMREGKKRYTEEIKEKRKVDKYYRGIPGLCRFGDLSLVLASFS